MLHNLNIVAKLPWSCFFRLKHQHPMWLSLFVAIFISILATEWTLPVTKEKKSLLVPYKSFFLAFNIIFLQSILQLSFLQRFVSLLFLMKLSLFFLIWITSKWFLVRAIISSFVIRSNSTSTICFILLFVMSAPICLHGIYFGFGTTTLFKSLWHRSTSFVQSHIHLSMTSSNIF